MNLEMSERMTATLVTQGYKPVDEPVDPQVVTRLGRDLHELTREVAALQQRLADGQAGAVTRPAEALTPLLAVQAQLTALCELVAAQSAQATQRLEALAERVEQLCAAGPPPAAVNGSVSRPAPRPGPLPATWERILAALGAYGPQRPYELDARLGLTKSRDMLRRLGAASLVIRQADGSYDLPPPATRSETAKEHSYGMDL
jgi:hypothetical protein